jgi:hypothetical protein
MPDVKSENIARFSVGFVESEPYVCTKNINLKYPSSDCTDSTYTEPPFGTANTRRSAETYFGRP